MHVSSAALRLARAAMVLVAAGIAQSGCGSQTPELPELTPPRFPSRIERPTSVTSGDHPNLIVISLDTLRADHLSAYGYDRPTSPSFDRIAGESVLFERAHSQSPHTAPSHMTLFTGLYPEAHRVQNRFAGTRESTGSLSRDLPTLAEMLSAAGYRAIGRTGGGNVEGALGFDRGFEAYSAPLLNVAGLFAAALDEIGTLARDGRPFFYFLHTYAIHSPYLPPPEYSDRFVDPGYAGRIVSDAKRLTGGDIQPARLHQEFWRRVNRNSPADRRHLVDLYDGAIRWADDQLGLLWDGLGRLDAASHTIVVVLSDHGEEFGEHGGFEHEALWEELLHVPLLIHVPPELRRGWTGRRIAAPVGLVDVLPTLLELLGLPTPDHLQGSSLVPLVETGAPFRPWLFAQYRRTGDLALRAGDWKLLRTAEGERFFDLSDDPHERHDVPGTGTPRSLVGEQLDRVLTVSRAYHSLAKEGPAVELDAADRERLEALGYVEPGAP